MEFINLKILLIGRVLCLDLDHIYSARFNNKRILFHLKSNKVQKLYIISQDDSSFNKQNKNKKNCASSYFFFIVIKEIT